MDPLTHTLTGLALSRAGLRRLSPWATPIALLAANAPDADILAAPWGAVTYLQYHRHITHSLVAVPVIAALVVLVVRLIARKPIGWRGAYVVALVAAVSHPLLDSWNTYGIRLLLPFSDEWRALDIVSLPDLWIWLVLLLAWLAPALAGLVSSEIGAKRGTGRGWAITALLFLTVFVFGRWVLHGRAVAMLDARMYDGAAPRHVAAFPSFANPFSWRGLVDAGNFYALYHVNVLGDFDPAGGEIVYKSAAGERERNAMETARGAEAFRVFLDFSRYPVWRFSPTPNEGLRVEATDLRFPFTATALIDPRGRIERAWFAFRPAEE
jgi:inner membrane protein